MAETLQYCIWCGTKVKPFPPLDGSTEEIHVLGQQADPRHTYACATCATRRLRPNLNETGENCAGCGQAVSYECSFCPRCGHRQRWAQAGPGVPAR